MLKTIAIGSLPSISTLAIVLLLGTASTGVAISSLSGAAATNATLAVFGGGAIAAGGMGMKAGAAFFGILVAIPIFVAGSYFTIKEYERKIEKLNALTKQIKNQIERLNFEISYYKKAFKKIETLGFNLDCFTLRVKKIVEEYNSFKKFNFFRKLNWFRKSNKNAERINKLKHDILDEWNCFINAYNYDNDKKYIKIQG